MAHCKSVPEVKDAITRNLREKTGKTIEEWLEIAQGGPGSRRERIAWLKARHKLGHFQATIVAERSLGAETDYSDQEALIGSLFAGSRAAHRVLFEQLVSFARSLGPDLRLTACKGYVGLSRSRQFATLQPMRDALRMHLVIEKKSIEIRRMEDSVKALLGKAYKSAR